MYVYEFVQCIYVNLYYMFMYIAAWFNIWNGTFDHHLFDNISYILSAIIYIGNNISASPSIQIRLMMNDEKKTMDKYRN